MSIDQQTRYYHPATSYVHERVRIGHQERTVLVFLPRTPVPMYPHEAISAAQAEKVKSA
jgi:hypothetical protein